MDGFLYKKSVPVAHVKQSAAVVPLQVAQAALQPVQVPIDGALPVAAVYSV